MWGNDIATRNLIHISKFLVASNVGLQTDRIRTDNVLIIFIFVIIFRIRIKIRIVSDTDRIFNGYWTRIKYRTNTYTNTNIFRILSKNIIYIIKKIIAYYFLIELLIIKVKYKLSLY
jgi:hypothetical protein